MLRLTLTSLMSEVADPLCAGLADLLAGMLGVSIEFDSDASTAQRLQMLDEQRVDLAWICGLLYVQKVQQANWTYQPLVAPVMQGSKTVQPVYFTHIVVQVQSRFRTFACLRGATWAYNERSSFSGFQAVRGHLALLGEIRPYFGQMVESGTHRQSIEMVRRGQADCAAIDSTVLDMLQSIDPGVLSELRVVERLGPYPMPLWVVSARCSHAQREAITDAFGRLHQDETGHQLLFHWQIQQFFSVDDGYYDPIRKAWADAERVLWR